MKYLAFFARLYKRACLLGGRWDGTTQDSGVPDLRRLI